MVGGEGQDIDSYLILSVFYLLRLTNTKLQTPNLPPELQAPNPKPFIFAAMTQEQIKDMRDRVQVLRGFL